MLSADARGTATSVKLNTSLDLDHAESRSNEQAGPEDRIETFTRAPCTRVLASRVLGVLAHADQLFELVESKR
jgi:hypothetical protein